MLGTTIQSAAHAAPTAGVHGARPRAAGATGHAGQGHTSAGDHISTGSAHESKTIQRAKPRGKGEFTIGAGILAAGALGYLATMAVFLTIDYYIQKNAVKNGIRAAVRTGSIGNNQNRINAAS